MTLKSKQWLAHPPPPPLFFILSRWFVGSFVGFLAAGQGLQRGVFSFYSQSADALPPDVVGAHTGSFVDLQVLAKSGSLSCLAKNLSTASLDNLEVVLS